MASYSLLIKPSARKELAALPKRDRVKIVQQIQALSDEPRPAGCEKLSGREQYRIRRGSYRVAYAIEDGGKVVLVIKIAHRKEAYR